VLPHAGVFIIPDPAKFAGTKLDNFRVRRQLGLGSSFGLESINTAASNSPTFAEPNAVWSCAWIVNSRGLFATLRRR